MRCRTRRSWQSGSACRRSRLRISRRGCTSAAIRTSRRSTNLSSATTEARWTSVRGRPDSRRRQRRERRADESVDLQRLIPRRSRRTHRTAELQALAYHRLIAERLDDEIADGARTRLRRWRREGRIHPRWSGEWERVLALPLPEIKRAISADTKRARELRQTSPFAGMLTEQERRRLVKAVEDRTSA